MTKVIELSELHAALAASWDEQTAYLGACEPDNPALGQCYPTARVVQHFFPETEVLKGTVWTGREVHIHFWNGRQINDQLEKIDLTWQQFPPGSQVWGFEVLDQPASQDSAETIRRCELLLQRVTDYLDSQK